MKYLLILLVSLNFFSCNQEDNTRELSMNASFNLAFGSISDSDLDNLLENGKILVSVLPIEETEEIILPLKDNYIRKGKEVTIKFEVEVSVRDKQLLSLMLVKDVDNNCNVTKVNGKEYCFYFSGVKFFDNKNKTIDMVLHPMFNLNVKVSSEDKNRLDKSIVVNYNSFLYTYKNKKMIFNKRKEVNQDLSTSFLSLVGNFEKINDNDNFPEYLREFDSSHFNTFLKASLPKEGSLKACIDRVLESHKGDSWLSYNMCYDKLGFSLPSKTRTDSDLILNPGVLKKEIKEFAIEYECNNNKNQCALLEDFENLKVKCFNSPKRQVIDGTRKNMNFFDHRKECVTSQVGDISANRNINTNIELFSINNDIKKKKILLSSLYVNNKVINLDNNKYKDFKINIGERLKKQTIVLGNFYLSGFNLDNIFVDTKEDKKLEAKVIIRYKDYTIAYTGPITLYSITSKLYQSMFDDGIEGWVLQNRYPFYTVYKNNTDGMSCKYDNDCTDKEKIACFENRCTEPYRWENGEVSENEEFINLSQNPKSISIQDKEEGSVLYEHTFN